MVGDTSLLTSYSTRYFVGELRIEAQIANFLSIISLLMVLQLGGIPVPTKGNR